MKLRTTLSASLAAGIAASVCCVGPLLLLTLGIGGAWIAYLTWFEPVRPVFLIITIIFLALAFRQLYLAPRECDAEGDCSPTRLRRQKLVFWMVSIPLLALLAFPWYASLFF